ncbi:Aste57867_11883 [Aphanomyces stellatus]|uniref:Aste57867_11883 protein n=1 Tax=Aphanomyces stellatus TaxID=120398 RepID=A0A485KU68_9STRA|nr:hypothetical protein As57867_011838 [Aphanomyces stellatus]VFT88738.1 Aste57867_11883 [Aphanomyces stellatus]
MSMKHRGVVAALAWSAVMATTLQFQNTCTFPIDVFDNDKTCVLAPGAAGCNRALSVGFDGMFRHGTSDQATLAEFAFDGAKVWYDISIVPPGSDKCVGLANCMAHSGHIGFNVPLSIFPLSSRDDPRYKCDYVVCYANGCIDAYQYPSDDFKTKSCPATTDLLVTFCPDLPP